MSQDHKVSAEYVAELCYSLGWRDRNLVIMVAVVGAASKFDTDYTGPQKYGLFALDWNYAVEWGYVSRERFIAMAKDPEKAAHRARGLYETRHFQPWPEYANLAYRHYLKDALVGYAKVLYRSFGLTMEAS